MDIILKKTDGSYARYDATKKGDWTAQEWADLKAQIQTNIDEIDADTTIYHDDTEKNAMMDAYKAAHTWEETVLYALDLRKRSDALILRRQLQAARLDLMNNDVKRLEAVPGG
jgi:hypothetical protein